MIYRVLSSSTSSAKPIEGVTYVNYNEDEETVTGTHRLLDEPGNVNSNCFRFRPLDFMSHASRLVWV